jgi:hypothetical protein
VIVEDDEPDTPDPEIATVFALVGVDADYAFEQSTPIGPSNPEQWYDIESGCYVDQELPLGLESEGQEDLAASSPAHDHGHSSNHQIGQQDNDRKTQRTSEELAPHSLFKSLDEDGGGWSEENISELGKHMLLAFEEQEESSATAPSYTQPRVYTEQSHPRID